MKKKKGNLPTSGANLGGGYLESKRNPGKFQKFKKNKKQKQVIIGSIIVLLLLVGGITLFKTFALYEEKKEFNVLKGRVPHFGIYKESILNGADPVLGENLIPVEIDNTGVVTKADLESKWYSYAEKRWANAVILVDKKVEYKNKEEIPEENIESYFVWIPKYSYQLWDLGNYSASTNWENGYSGLTGINASKVHTIPIKFGTENTSDAKEGECTTPMTSGVSGNCKVGDYMTPPSFISMGTNGLWVGKFETGYKGATSTTEAQVNANDATKVQIKPNVYSWRNITVSNAFYSSYNYMRELDSHMMKNTEWGAVAYLQHSQYGSSKLIRLNNNGSYITGYASKKEPTCGYTAANDECNKYENTILGVDGTYTINYKNTLSQVASTTGNYTGIYDMGGGAQEYVMGLVSGNDQSGFTNFPNLKYYDSYNLSSSVYDLVYSARILGDATGEMGPFGKNIVNKYVRPLNSWYKAESYYPIEGNWFSRGGSITHGISSNIFAFSRPSGAVNEVMSFRIILAI